jgi:ribonuclease HI
VISLGIKRLLIYGDSLLVVEQINKEWDCNKEAMDAYVMEAQKLENKFSGLEIHHEIRDKMLEHTYYLSWHQLMLRFQQACSCKSSSTHQSKL